MTEGDDFAEATGNLLESEEFHPWAKSAMEILLKKTKGARLRGSKIFIGSDYGGDHKESPFLLYGFLIADVDFSPHWPGAIWEIKQIYLPDGRRMAFKRLNDKIRQRALYPFLTTASETLVGHLVIFLVWKKHKFLTTGAPDVFLSVFKDNGVLNADWNVNDLEKMARICHLGAIAVGGVARPNVNIMWVTDQDKIIANAKRLHDTQRVASFMLSMVISPQSVTVLPTKQKLYFNSTLATPWHEDTLAIPDLSVGALSEIFMKWTKSGQHLENLKDHILVDNRISQKTQDISRWLGSTDGTLKRTILLLRPDGAYEFNLLPLYQA